MAISQKTALARARHACHIWKGGQGWMLTSPWKASDPGGPSTERSCADYQDAKYRLSLAVADVAMEQMLDGEDLDLRQAVYFQMMVLHDNYEITGSASLLRAGLTYAREQKGADAAACSASVAHPRSTQTLGLKINGQ